MQIGDKVKALREIQAYGSKEILDFITVAIAGDVGEIKDISDIPLDDSELHAVSVQFDGGLMVFTEWKDGRNAELHSKINDSIALI